MATWEQSGNPGGLLGSIGQNNSNAPRVGDINSTLEYIRNNNDRERSGENNLGLTALRGLGAVKQGLDQNDAAQQAKDFQSAYGSAYASGDRNAMRQLAAKYPGQMEAVQKGMGFIDDDQRATVGNLAASARLAASNPETFTKWLQNNAADLDRAGVDPQHVAQMYQQDPKGFGDFADHLGLAALGPDKYFDVQDKMAGRQLEGDRNQLTARGQDITARGQDMDNARGWAGINIQQQNTNLRRMELDDKKYDRQIANETNALKLADLQDKRQQNQQAIEHGKRDKVDAFSRANDTLDQTLDTASRVLKSPGFDKYFGVSMTKLPGVGTIPGTDAADTEALVNTLSSQGFLTSIQQMKGMGALSDAEGKKISSAIASLDSKQSDKSARAAVNTIISVTQAAKERLQKHAPDIAQTQRSLPQAPPQSAQPQAPVQQPAQQQQQTAPQQQAGYSSLWGD